MKDWTVLFLFFFPLGSGLAGNGVQKLNIPSALLKAAPSGSILRMQDTLQYDGPYIFYQRDKIITRLVVQVNGKNSLQEDSLPVSQKQNLVLSVKTDEPGKFFQVHLKEKLVNEKNVFKGVQKQFVVSDIEGNFSAFRKLLQSNGVIDQELNWTFGNGHLVLTGDFFDRGEQVTETLWFIYSLEDKARAAGGYVHYILGNHEIMNLTSDLRYVNPKYIANATLLGIKYGSLYDGNTELGRWLRTKNIIERIGQVLFMHGGISPEVNRMDLSVKDIDQIARPYYADTLYGYKDQRLNILLGDLGPFWYRGYYPGSATTTAEQIDSTLRQFKIRHIATGHSIVADTVSMWYNGRLFNTDTHHASGKSEALFMEGNKYYRVNATGNKVLLLTD